MSLCVVYCFNVDLWQFVVVFWCCYFAVAVVFELDCLVIALFAGVYW